MARSFKELGRESTELIEQGKELESHVQQCKMQIQSAAAAVASARQNLEQVSQVDEEGNAVGDVSEANARLAVAQNQLAASQRALQRAQQAVERNNQQKRLQVQRIEQHNKTSRANISRLVALSELSFSENADEVQQGLIERYYEIEQARVALLESMGEKASVESIQAPALGSTSSRWTGIGYGALDLSGEPQSYQGSHSQGSPNSLNGQQSYAPMGNNGIAVANGDVAKGESNSDNAVKSGKKNEESSESTGDTDSKSKNFSGFEIDKHINGSDYFIKGANYERFKNDYYSSENYTYNIFDKPKTVNVSPSLIEGIHLSEYDVDHPSNFWSQHKRDGSQESFREIAKHIPEVRKQLDAGRTKEDLLQDPVLGTCTQIYFVDKTRVVECDGYYEFDSNGRHRILAARELGFDIPVEVIGRKEYPQTANRLLDRMPRESDFNSSPNRSINSSINYNLKRYGKDSHQYQALASRSLDPLRAVISHNETIAASFSKRFEELNERIESDFNFSSSENKSKIIAKMREYQSAVKILQADINSRRVSLNEQATRLGLSKEHVNTRFVGFNGNTDIFHACDNIITSKQTGGTCGINCSVSCANQVLGTHRTQYEGFKVFADNKWCVTDAKKESQIGGTNYIHREKYLNHIGLDCESKIVDDNSLREMSNRLFNGESVMMTLHAQDLNSSGLIDNASRQPHIEKHEDREVLVVDNAANHAVNVVGFEVDQIGDVKSIFINDTGGWNDFTDDNQTHNRVNLIPIAIEKFKAMVKNTKGMCVQYVKRRNKQR